MIKGSIWIVLFLLILCCLQPADSLASNSQAADLALINGKIITVDAKDSIIQAVAIKGDKILDAGTNTQIQALIGPQTKVVDLKGKCVTPGIVDSHIHVLYYGRQFWDGFLNIRYPAVKNETDLLKAIVEKVNNTPKGRWISANQGFHIDSSSILDRWVLDKVAPDNPIYLRHSSGQYSVVNSLALKMAGIDRNTPDPYGGKIVHDPSTGLPTGMLLHYPAENLVGAIAPGYGNRSDSELETDLKIGQDICLSAGITSGQDVIVSSLRDIKAYKDLADKGELKMRMYLMLYVSSEDQARELVKSLKGYKSDMLTFGGWKLAIDGGLAAGTALMYDNSLTASKNSYYYFEPDTLKRIVRILHDSGLQVAFHIVGDKGIDEALDAIESATEANPRNDTRYRIEHALFIDPSSLERIKKDGVVISTSPQWISWHADSYRQATNDRSMANFMPIGTMLKMGIPLAFGCDVPASITHEPKWAFLGAILRTTSSGYKPDPDECIDISKALRAHTMGSAYAAFEEDSKGSIEPGKFADLVVWSQDLYKLKPQQFNDLRPLMTYVGGKLVYEDKSQEGVT